MDMGRARGLGRRLASLGILVVMTITATAALWPVPVAGKPGSEGEMARCESKMARLLEAIRAGSDARTRFSEGEINARLADILGQNPGAREARGLTVGVNGLSFAAAREEGTLFVRGELFGVPLVATLTWRERDGAPSGVRSARLGRLPLVGPFKWLLVRRLDAMTRRLEGERRILEHLASLELEDGAALVAVSGAAGR